jgi:hypothetical protein
LPESRPGCELASETRHCHRTPGATLANAAEFAYDQVLIVAGARDAGRDNPLLEQKRSRIGMERLPMAGVWARRRSAP